MAPDDAAAQPPNRLVAAYGLYYLDNRPVVLRAAELPYFRVPAGRWAATLALLVQAGCSAVASDIPWSWHEPRRGDLDFTGRTDPRRNLAAFLDAVQRAGLVLLARPGPAACAAPPEGGYPSWLPTTVAAALARGPDGQPPRRGALQVYSLLHPEYLREVERWYVAVAAAVRPYLGAPVVTWQLDSQTGRAFASAIGRLDFNPDTVARYRSYLQETYEVAGLLAREWRRPVESFHAVRPPRASATLGELQDWQAFLERWVAQYLDHLRGVARALGITLPLVVAEAADYASPQNPRLKAPVADLYGFVSATYSRGRRAPQCAFAGSRHASRFQQFAAEARPLSCWGLGAGDWGLGTPGETAAALLQHLVAGVAHGLKAYGLKVAASADGASDLWGLDRLARFQAFLAACEEELTASVEVQDAIAYLDFQPYTRQGPDDLWPHLGSADPLRTLANRALLALHAVLLTAGYNPPFVDLEAATDETLAEFSAAVFPSRGYIDLQNYGKLVVFALRGGSLVTFPEPASHQRDGSPLNTAFLWPHRPGKARWPGRALLLGNLAAGAARQALHHFWRLRRQPAGRLPGALWFPDVLESALAGYLTPIPGAALRWPGSPHSAGTVRGDFRLVEFPTAGRPLVRYGTGSAPGRLRRAAAAALQAEVLLRRGGTPIGYRVQVRDGTSTVLGTILGGAYLTSRYPPRSPRERRDLRRFVVELFEAAAPRKVVPDDDLEVEAVARLSPDGGCLLFVINRLGAQTGALRFPYPAALNLGDSLQAEVLFSHLGSSAAAANDGLRLNLAAGDTMVVRLR